LVKQFVGSEIIDLLPDALFHISASGNVLYANNVALKLGDVSENEISDKTIADLFVQSVAHLFHEQIEKALLPSFDGKLEFNWDAEDGRWLCARLTKGPNDADGCGSVLVTINDLSDEQTKLKELQDLQHRLRESKDQLDTLASAIPDMIWLKDINGNFVFANNRIEQYMDVKPGGLLGKHDRDFYPEETSNEFWTEDQHVIHSGLEHVYVYDHHDLVTGKSAYWKSERIVL
jgi:PAS domain S-box-containing protein